MKKLTDILYQVTLLEVVGSTHVEVVDLCFDSRKCVEGSVYIAIKGVQADGHDFIEGAIQNGATVVVCEEFPSITHKGINYIKVDSTRKALAQMAANYYEHPSNNLTLVGVTGTNGKTTNVMMLFQLFRDLGYKVGMLSTVENKINDKVLEASLTTPDALGVNAMLDEMVAEGCEYCFMEVSSHALDQYRVYGLNFKVAAFTNISHDHLDYHHTFKEYINAKKLFFDWLGSDAIALVNQDDKHAEIMLQNTKAEKKSFGLRSVADFKAKILENQFSGLLLSIENKEVYTKLIGTFNAYNILSVYAIAVSLGLEELEVLTAISNLKAAPGRFQYIKTPEEVTAIVDYAHTPDALENVLKTITDVRTGNETVICVVGCGGDRDKTKRPIMAKIAAENSDKVILTSDNPRTENPDAIIEDMKVGVEPQHYKKILSITDRKEAIKTACSLAEPNDIILVAGKGHETYQIVGTEKLPFDDLQILDETFKMLNS